MVTAGPVVPRIDLRITPGDTFFQGFRRERNGTIIDTSTGFSAIMIIRRSYGDRRIVCELVSGAPVDGKGIIELGIDGPVPQPNQRDMRTNLRILMVPEITALISTDSGQRLVYTMSVTGPTGMVRTWMMGDVRTQADTRYGR